MQARPEIILIQKLYTWYVLCCLHNGFCDEKSVEGSKSDRKNKIKVKRKMRNLNSQQFGLLWHLMRFTLVSTTESYIAYSSCFFLFFFFSVSFFPFSSFIFSIILLAVVFLKRFSSLWIIRSFTHIHTHAHLFVTLNRITHIESKLWTVLSWFGTFTLTRSFTGYRSPIQIGFGQVYKFVYVIAYTWSILMSFFPGEFSTFFFFILAGFRNFFFFFFGNSAITF